MIIRICTEDKHHEQVRELCAKRFDGFTVLHGMGVWKGKLEPCLVIEIASLSQEDADHNKMLAAYLARDIKELNEQEAVLIEYIESTNVLI